MTTRIEATGPSSSIAPLPTASRVTPAPSRPFHNVLRAGAGAVISGAESAVSSLPGGPVLAAAVRPAPSPPSALTPQGSAGTAGSNPIGMSGEAETNVAQSTDAQQIEGALDANLDRNLYYLQLQERISAESREYSALSNVLKARHDTMKNAIGNLR